MLIINFLLWTCLLYWIHRFSHEAPLIKKYHMSHHEYITTGAITKWHWNNIFLVNDNLKGTIDLWVTEVLPTIIFSYITGEWIILLFYYVWAAFIQESIEHNVNFDMPLITSGKWHLIHHRSPHNYGLFFPLWDIIFGTFKRANDDLY